MTLRSLLGLPVLAICTLAPAAPLAAGQAPCGSPPFGWETTQPDSTRVFNTVGVHGKGDNVRLSWNGAAVTPEQVREYVELTKELKPVPTLLLTVAPSAECGEVRRLRQMIDKTLACENGQCVERGS